MLHTYNFNIQESGVGESHIWAEPGLHRKFKASLNYIMKPCFTNTNKKEKEKEEEKDKEEEEQEDEEEERRREKRRQREYWERIAKHFLHRKPPA